MSRLLKASAAINILRFLRVCFFLIPVPFFFSYPVAFRELLTSVHSCAEQRWMHFVNVSRGVRLRGAAGSPSCCGRQGAELSSDGSLWKNSWVLECFCLGWGSCKPPTPPSPFPARSITPVLFICSAPALGIMESLRLKRSITSSSPTISCVCDRPRPCHSV